MATQLHSRSEHEYNALTKHYAHFLHPRGRCGPDQDHALTAQSMRRFKIFPTTAASSNLEQSARGIMGGNVVAFGRAHEQLGAASLDRSFMRTQSLQREGLAGLGVITEDLGSEDMRCTVKNC